MFRDHLCNFAACSELSHLATLLGVKLEVLNALAAPTARESHFITHQIPKRSGGGKLRVVIEPLTDELKFTYKVLATRLTRYAEHVVPGFPNEHTFGFIRHRSTRENAGVHVGAKVLLRTDIRDFFQSVSAPRVKGILLDLKVKDGIADYLMRILCPTGYTAPGLSTSPIVSNLACIRLDERLGTSARRIGAKYSRYADDIAISGHAVPSRNEVAEIVEAEGFALATEKFRVTKPGQAHFVTGLSISDPIKPHVPKQMKRALRQEMYYASKYGIAGHIERRGNETVRHAVNRIDGTVQYVAHIEGDKGDHRLLWRELMDRAGLRPSYSPRWDRVPGRRNVAIDETSFEVAGRKFMAVCAIVFDELESLRAPLIALRDAYIADPYSVGKKNDILKEGLHFSASHPNLKFDTVKTIAELPFRAYVVFCELGEDYESTYLSVLSSVAQVVASRCDRKVLSIHVERNGQVSSPKIEQTIRGVLFALEEADSRRPIRIENFSIADKTFVPCWIADTVLGVFREYSASVEADGTSLARNLFERLRHRISFILDLHRHTAYTRRRPFTPLQPSG